MRTHLTIYHLASSQTVFVPLWLILCLSVALNLLPRCHPPSVYEYVYTGVCVIHPSDTLLCSKHTLNMQACADWGFEKHMDVDMVVLCWKLTLFLFHQHLHTHTHFLSCGCGIIFIELHKHRAYRRTTHSLRGHQKHQRKHTHSWPWSCIKGWLRQWQSLKDYKPCTLWPHNTHTEDDFRG